MKARTRCGGRISIRRAARKFESKSNAVKHNRFNLHILRSVWGLSVSIIFFFSFQSNCDEARVVRQHRPLKSPVGVYVLRFVLPRSFAQVQGLLFANLLPVCPSVHWFDALSSQKEPLSGTSFDFWNWSWTEHDRRFVATREEGR